MRTPIAPWLGKWIFGATFSIRSDYLQFLANSNGAKSWQGVIERCAFGRSWKIVLELTLPAIITGSHSGPFPGLSTNYSIAACCEANFMDARPYLLEFLEHRSKIIINV